MHWTDKLKDLGACSEAIKWAATQPYLRTAWDRCERGDWMLWLAGRVSGEVGSPARLRVVAAAADCAELALPVWEARYPDDTRPREAIAVARRYAAGEATLVEARASASAAYAAASASYAAAAAYAADAADAADAAASASAYAAASASADAAADAYAAYAERVRVLRECADICRRHFPDSPSCKSLKFLADLKRFKKCDPGG